MAEEGKIDAAKKAKESHGEFLEKTKSAANSISESNKTEEIKKQIEIEREVEKLRNKTEIITERLKIKIKTDGNLTAEQKALIDSLIASMQDRTGSLKIEINQNKEKIKLEIKRRTNMSEEEIEDEIGKIEREPKMCAQVITPAKNEATGECREFPTPCNVPDGWKKVENCISTDSNACGNKIKEREHKFCAQVITPAKNEATGECREFQSPCNVPDGWKKVDGCSQLY